MSDAGFDGDGDDDGREEHEEHYQRRYSPRGQFQFSSVMSEYPTRKQLKVVEDGEGENSGTPYDSEPTGWWGSRDARRPWREKPELKRKASVPPEQSERWARTKTRVSYAVRSTLGYGLDATHEALQIGADVLRFSPIPGLEEAARVLLTIWDALQLVETNRLACLRLTERCADILLSIREEIHEAGDHVGDELTMPLQKLVESFKSVHILLQKQVHRPFLKRYLKRDDILRSINGCDAALSDALGLFSISIQIRTLRQLQAAEAQRKADTERLLASLTPPIDLDVTPKQKSIELPAEDSPPAYTTTSSGGTGTTTGSSATKTASTTTSGVQTTEVVQSPPPTPDSQGRDSGAPRVTSPAPPTPEEIRVQLSTIVERQNTLDHALDLADLRTLMREALATSTDAEMLRVLQINREDIAEAMKTLQRALEQECEKEDIEEAGNDSLQALEETAETDTDVNSKGGSGALGLTGLRRRLTMDSVTTRSSKKSKNAKRTAKGSRRPTVSERDTLDREFMETGIDALRRLSSGQEINLPSWTITRYEIDMEVKIGYGYFSDVYRARWRNQTVAVKVLTLATPQKLFIHEMSVWRTLQHPNVLPLLGASSATGDPPWFLVSPFMKNGNLVDYLRGTKLPVEGAIERRMVYEVAKGMAYLHRKGVMHGDLKGTNVLIDDKGHCVLTDFGQSEMKSEAYRMSGNHPPRGTLRWQAPEIVDGASSGRLTYQVDIYAYAIVCVEIFGHGTLPWGVVDDDAYRRLVIEEDKRPPITSPNASKGILDIIETCWARDPSTRPTFQKVVRELKKLGLDKYTNSPALGGKASLFEDGSLKRKQSPDMRPVSLPDVEEPDTYSRQRSASTRSNPGPSTSSTSSHSLSTGKIPIQRIITPIREEDKVPDSKGASPVDYKPIKLPEASQTSPNGLQARDMRIRSKSEGSVPLHDDSASSSRTTSSDANTEPYTNGPGILELERFESPPPADEVIAQRKNENRYRLRLQHSFHTSLNLALWEPSPVCLGAVGYLMRPAGKFVTLFNAFDPPKTSDGRADDMSNLYGYGRVDKGNQRQDRRNITQRGLDIIQGLMWFRSRTSGDYQQNVSRRVSFPIRAGHKSAYIYVEQTIYRYVADLTTPKRWFQANVDRILELYGKEHRLQKEDIYLIIGTLDTPDYGLFVNHNNPDGQVHFNVFASPRSGQKWGAFSIDTESLPPDLAGGPSYHEDVPGKHAAASKVSEVSSARPWDTVLLARLRFRPDEDNATAL